jgi:hypothetical protein
MFLSFATWAQIFFGRGVVRCCPSLKKPASMAQENQMGHLNDHQVLNMFFKFPRCSPTLEPSIIQGHNSRHSIGSTTCVKQD